MRLASRKPVAFTTPRAAVLAIAIFVGACANMASEPAAPASLYERLGEKPAITAVVDQFIANVAADTRINAYFANADIPGLKAKLVDQICQATGGPCVYKGQSMLAAHKGMNIKDGEFNALVEDLVAALDTFKVPEAEKGELLGALAAMRGDIVGR